MERVVSRVSPHRPAEHEAAALCEIVDKIIKGELEVR
jgi:hypothetical protein